MYLGPEPDEVITVKAFEKHRTACHRRRHHLFLPALSLGTGLLYISDGLWCITRQNQRPSLILDHHVILNPDAQAAKTLWHLVIVLADVQPCDKKWNIYESRNNMKHKPE